VSCRATQSIVTDPAFEPWACTVRTPCGDGAVHDWRCAAGVVFHTPGALVVCDPADRDAFLTALRAAPGAPSVPAAAGTVTHSTAAAFLAGRAHAATAARRDMTRGPFVPECLTLFLSNACTLRCVYCHTGPTSPSTLDPVLTAPEILAAAGLIAAACAARGAPLRVVFHGGGEPTLHRALIDSLLPELRAVADRHGIRLWTYVATNGAVSEADAQWIAKTFDLVGLSFDGLPEFQDRYRPFPHGRGSSETVLRTGRILRQRGQPLHVRTTVTPASMLRQTDMAAFIIEQFAPTVIRFEPAYHARNAPPVFAAADAAPFVRHFLEALAFTRSHHVALETSGSRPDTIHGPYCNTLRGVLNPVPGGVLTACFERSRAEEVRRSGLAVGAYASRTGTWTLDEDRMADLRSKACRVPSRCAGCFNVCHCTRGCPDTCPLSRPNDAADPFRCRVHGALAFATLSATAHEVVQAVGATPAPGKALVKILGNPP
jgi:uncharacterized protein